MAAARLWRFPARREIEDRLINDLGQRAVASAARHLDAAGIAHKDRVEFGEPQIRSSDVRTRKSCDLIVLAETRPTAMRGWLMRALRLSIGSTASFVVHLARVPVVVAP